MAGRRVGLDRAEMTTFEKAALVCTILLVLASLALSIYVHGLVTMLSERVDVLDDAATPSFQQSEPDEQMPAFDVELRQFNDSTGKPHTFQFRGEP